MVWSSALVWSSPLPVGDMYHRMSYLGRFSPCAHFKWWKARKLGNCWPEASPCVPFCLERRVIKPMRQYSLHWRRFCYGVPLPVPPLLPPVCHLVSCGLAAHVHTYPSQHHHGACRPSRKREDSELRCRAPPLLCAAKLTKPTASGLPTPLRSTPLPASPMQLGWHTMLPPAATACHTLSRSTRWLADASAGAASSAQSARSWP